MELGRGKLLRTGLNALHQAIHPVHGLAWTDGRLVVLTALYLHTEEPKFGDSTVIGQFEHVHGLYWGPIFAEDTPALLAIQHKKHITVWQLFYNSVDKSKLVVSQTCEISEMFPVLPQGCLWHPKMDILAVMTRRDACVLHNVRTDNANIRAEVKSSGVIHCACWTKEGNRLVVAIGSSLYSYVWDHANKSLNACLFCPIFDIGSCICAIESTVDVQVAVATELPLDRICGLNSGITFDVPAGAKIGSLSIQHNVPFTDEEFSMDGGRKYSELEKCKTLDSLAAASPGPINLTHILANHRKSESSPLIYLKRKDFVTGSGQDSSHLILVTFEKKVTSTRKVSIPGIIVPDILAFDHRAHIMAVASNTCSTVLVYSLTSSSLPNIQQIQLETNERPKGLCFLSERMLLVLVGKQKFSNPAFLPSSNSDKYTISLMVKEVVFEDDSSASSAGSQSALSAVDSCASLPGKKKYLDHLSRDIRNVSRELLIPGSTAIYPFVGRKRLIEEVKSPNGEQSPTSSASDCEEKTSLITMNALETEPRNRPFALHNLEMPSRLSNRPLSPKVQPSVDHEISNVTKNNQPLEKGASLVYRNLERLNSCFTELHQALCEVSDPTRNGRKLPPIYPPSQEPSYVYISCQPLSAGDGVNEKKLFLLCEGKLQLSVVQGVFNLSLVEMQHGSSWIVLTTDSEGFVPLTFRTAQEIIIRDASVRSKVTVHSSENNSDASIYSEPVT
ncbi:WD repeat and coiled-coil-containing protein isoform X2 [Pleurodeles waltl]|uniref:WD repeat and coiled-coil-containing protein isoform X2 n=1 Tax=Pleurodeles waltl TaxID=8319 RepID=UPI0037093D3D